MNTKTTKFLAVLAVLAFAFAVFAVTVPGEGMEANQAQTGMTVQIDSGDPVSYTEAPENFTNNTEAYLGHNVTIMYYSGTTTFTSMYQEEVNGVVEKRAVTFILEDIESAAGLTIVMNGTSGVNTYIYGTATKGSLKMLAPETDSTYTNAGNLRVGTGATNDLVMPEINAWVATYTSVAPSIANLGTDNQTVTIDDYGLLSYDGTNIGATFDDNIVTKTSLTDDTLYAVGNVATPAGGLYLYAGSSATTYDGTISITAGSSITGKIYAYKVHTAAAVDTVEKAKAIRSAAKLVFDGTIGATAITNLTAGGATATDKPVAGYMTVTAANLPTIGMLLENKGTIDITSAVTIAGIVENNGEIKLVATSTIGGTYDEESFGAIITGSGKTTAGGAIYVSDAVVENLIATAGAGNAITISAGKSFEGTITVGTTEVAELRLKASSVTAVTLTPGSLKIAGNVDATFAGSFITAISDDVSIDENGLTVTGGANGGALTIDGKLAVGGDITLASKATLNVAEEAVLTIADGKKIDVVSGTILNIDGTIKADSAATGTGYIANAQGGIVKKTSNATVTVDITGAGMVVDEDDMEIVKVKGTSVQQTPFPDYQTVVVDGSWILGTGTSLTTGAIITINGKLIIPADSTLTIKANAQLIIANTATFIVEGTLVIEESDIIGDVTYPAGSLTISNGAMTVKGKVSNDGSIILGNSMVIDVAENGLFVIEEVGTITTGDEAQFTIAEGAELRVLGDFGGSTVYNSGTVIVDSEFAATNNSMIYQIYDGAVVEIREYTVKASAEAKLTISDYGMILVEYRAEKVDHTIYRNADSEGIVIGMSLTDTSAITDLADYSVSFSGLVIKSNVTTSAATKEGPSDSERIYNWKVYDKEMDISGTLSVAYSYNGQSSGVSTYTEAATVTAIGSKLVVSDEVKITEGVTFMIYSYGSLKVTGSIETDDDTAVFAASATATITVSGEGLITSYKNPVGSEAGMNAARIVTKLTEPAVKIYLYMSIDSALNYLNEDQSDVNQIIVYGKQTVTKSNYLAAGDELVNNGVLTIGKSGATSVELTIKNGAKLKGTGSVTVNGTLFVENKSNNTIASSKISSDVYKCQVDEEGKEISTGWAMWTNIATAIEKADVGETVTLKQDASLYSNLLIPDYVILDVPASKKLVIMDGVTLTVAGILKIEGDVFAETSFDLVAKDVTATTNLYSSTIVVTGVIMSTGNLSYTSGNILNNHNAGNKNLNAGAPIAGAYYSVKKYNVISDLSVALDSIDAILDDIVVYGEVTEGDLVFTATRNCVKITLNGANYTTKSVDYSTPKTIVNKLTVDSITLENGAVFVIAENNNINNNMFSGKVVIGDATITAVGLSTKDSDVTFKANTSGVFTIAGAAAITDKGDSLSFDEGTVYISGFTMAQATKGTKTTGDSNYDYTTTVTVAAGATIQADAAAGNTFINMTVNGTVKVPAGKQMQIYNATVLGTLDVAAATSTTTDGTLTLGGKETVYNSNANTYTYGKAYLGTTSKLTSASAVLAGPITGYADGTNGAVVIYVSATATVDDACQASLDKMYSTELYVEGTLWLTLYSPLGMKETVSTIPVENAELMGWNSSATGTGTNKVVTIGDYAKVYAYINYNIYNVTIYTDAGIKSVSIDGVVLESPTSGVNEFKTLVGLKTGTHTVTFTLKDGYEGTVSLYTMDKTILKDLKFTTSGTTATDKAVKLQLLGTEPIPEPTPTPEEKSEWTITTILLCILVVLIAIMAVIVALRLNRS